MRERVTGVPPAVRRGVDRTRDALHGGKLSGLVNNAGIAVPGPLLEMPVADLRPQLEVNVVSVLTVTRAFFPLLRSRAGGNGTPARIVNISSVAGVYALPFPGPSAASKHGVEGLSDSLRRESMRYGIDVIVIDPGIVASAIWDKADALDLSPYSASPFLQPMTRLRDLMSRSGRTGLPPEKVGRVVLKALTAGKPRVRYAAGSGNPMTWIPRHLPGGRSMDGMFAKRFGLNGR
jgi:NAD(P)-dependent dehydrogenase (short-subunit alcohol dehydrogenase family)